MSAVDLGCGLDRLVAEVVPCNGGVEQLERTFAWAVYKHAREVHSDVVWPALLFQLRVPRCSCGVMYTSFEVFDCAAANPIDRRASTRHTMLSPKDDNWSRRG
jgi:hypothetical protein